MRARIRGPFIALSVFAMLAAGCGGTAKVAGGGGDKTLVFVSYGGAYQKAQDTAFVKPFEKEFGVSVAQQNTSAFAKAKAMVDAGNVTWDVMDESPYYAIGNCGTYFEKLDFNVIDTSKVVDRAFVTPCAVPDMQFSYVLMYKKEKYGNNPPKSYADFFDTKKFPGKRSIFNQPYGGYLEAALLADGVPEDQLYPLDIDRALRKLDTIKKGAIFAANSTVEQQLMESGEVDMLIIASGRAVLAVQNGADFAPVWDQNIITYDSMMVPKGAPHKDLAMKFISHAISAAAQKTFAESITYGPINSDAKPAISELQASYLPTDPKVKSTSVRQDMQWYATNLKDVVSKWNAWATG